MSAGTGSPVEGRVEHNASSTGAVVGRMVTLRIANQSIRFQANGAGVDLFLHDSHIPFRVPDDTQIDCEVSWTIEGVAPAQAPVIHRFGHRWEIRQLSGGREEITFYNPVGNDQRLRPTMQILSDAEFTSLQVRQAPRAGSPSLAYVSEYPWAEYIVQRRLALHGGVILHAAMAVWEGVAYVLMGHSGAGKSTLAELAEELGATIPTDDRTILTINESGITAWGTPWHGSFRRTSPDSAPVGLIALLVHGTDDHIEPMEPRRAVKEMYVRTVQARISEREVQRTLDTIEVVASRVPCYELRFLPTTAAMRLLRSAVRSEFPSRGEP